VSHTPARPRIAASRDQLRTLVRQHLRPVVAPRTQKRMSPALAKRLGSVVHWTTTGYRSPNSAGHSGGARPAAHVLYVEPGGDCPITIVAIWPRGEGRWSCREHPLFGLKVQRGWFAHSPERGDAAGALDLRGLPDMRVLQTLGAAEANWPAIASIVARAGAGNSESQTACL